MSKYKLPWTHETVQTQAYFDLLIEYFEDLFQNDKTAMYREIESKDGHVMLPETGDELIDKWERELAMGIEPDLEEGYTQAQRDQLKKERDRTVGAKQRIRQMGDLNEDYSPQNVALLGRDSKVPSNVMEFARKGGFSGMDPSAIKRIISQLPPDQATEIINILNTK